jgi:hypothetical protein
MPVGAEAANTLPAQASRNAEIVAATKAFSILVIEQSSLSR